MRTAVGSRQPLVLPGVIESSAVLHPRVAGGGNRREPWGGRAAPICSPMRHPTLSIGGSHRGAATLSAEVPELLRHRGGFLPRRPDSGLFASLGGEAGIHRLVGELYDRIGADPLLRHIFPHPEVRDGPKRFFVEWFGGPPAFSGGLHAGLTRAHQHLVVSPQGATA